MSCFFDIEYENYAWGYEHNGILILEDSDINVYDLSNFKNTKTNIQTKYDNSINIGKLPQDTMNHLCLLLSKVKPSEIYLKSVGFDGGNTSYIGYIQSINGWNEIKLKIDGDMYGENPTATELVILLEEIYKNTNKIHRKIV